MHPFHSHLPCARCQAFEYLKYVREQRNGSAAYQASITRALIRLAKFMFKDEVAPSSSRPLRSAAEGVGVGAGQPAAESGSDGDGWAGSGWGADRPFDRLPVIRSLRKLHRQSFEAAKKVRRGGEVGDKWIPWPQVLQMVHSLREEAVATTTAAGSLESFVSLARFAAPNFCCVSHGVFCCWLTSCTSILEYELQSLVAPFAACSLA
jgi:anti-sigma factor RsiW